MNYKDFKIKEGAEAPYLDNGFWYGLAYGGDIKPEELLEDPKQVKLVEDAVKTLFGFCTALEQAGLIDEF